MTWDIEDTSSAGENAPPKVALKKEIGVLQGVSIVFGIIVGSGIFVSPVGVLQYSQSVGLSFIMWLVTGLFSLLGAIVYAELGVRIPKSGGEYAYLLEAFGGLPAFICMWVSFVVIGGVSCAANSLVFAQYILQPLYPNCEQPKVVLQITALLCLLLICAINAYKVKWATRVAVIFSAGKIIALLLITGFGIYYLATGHLESFENPFEGSATSPGLLALAFYQGFWAFSGWNYLNFLVEEMDNPGRNLPLAIVLGLGLVTGLYMLANVAYLAVLSPFELLGTGDGSAAVAVLFANRAMPWIAHAMPVFVGASVFGSINSEVMSMSRLAFAGAREGHMPTVLALVHHENLTPLPSILAILPIFFPILFLFCDLFILCLTAYQQPKESLSNIILMLSAIPIYLVFVSWKRKPKSFTDFVYKLTICLQKVFASVPVDDVEEAEGGADV
ncbi:unnamed protein product [Schistocephalus solidus]|uniref:Y+L amino acid transporter 2 n=1 Tax=Schistocephalus solidus TaxID=70667 RepID=A0A183T354_SCHSO|nr:unnamed protein product [Schistocephalus solidus]